MNTCGTCKYRGKEMVGYKPIYDAKGNYVDAEKVPLTYFLCGRVKMSDEIIYEDSGRWQEPGSKAVVTDGSGYYAALCVENDFGCTLWEGK